MSGKRRKALRAASKAEHGRPPSGARFRGGVQVEQDEMRPIKKAWTRRRR